MIHYHLAYASDGTAAPSSHSLHRNTIHAAEPQVAGFVTRVASPADFDVDGLHVLLTPTTTLQAARAETFSELPSIAPYLGQYALVWGKVDNASLAIAASRIAFITPQPSIVSGTAIIDLVLPATSPNQRIRADGRILEIPANVLSQPAPGTPAATASDLHTNLWIDYHGQQRTDGIVIVDELTLAPNQIATSEGKLLQKSAYDLAAVLPESHQSAASKAIRGIDYKKIPPFHDSAQQARIDRIGQSLIPAYQKSLASDDPTHIHFQFQLVDQPHWRNAVPLPSGVVLVPRQIVALLASDSQLAAILADSIAITLEKQTLRNQASRHFIPAAMVASAALTTVVPGAGVVGGVVGSRKLELILSLAEQQAGRVALTLMHDAGYDITQAPEAWWTLAAGPGKDAHRQSPPERALNQYEELGTTWHPVTP